MVSFRTCVREPWRLSRIEMIGMIYDEHPVSTFCAGKRLEAIVLCANSMFNSTFPIGHPYLPRYSANPHLRKWRRQPQRGASNRPRKKAMSNPQVRHPCHMGLSAHRLTPYFLRRGYI